MALRLADLPYTKVEALLASGRPVVAVLPVGATEAHGPHLPLSTDVVISEAFAAAAAELLDLDGVTAVLLPPLSYTPADYAASFPGTVTVRWETLAALLTDIGASLKRQGFACLAIANSHFDPANVNVLRNAANEIAAAGLPVAFADATRRKFAARLTAEFQSGDCHAGQFESSIVLAARPELVNERALRELPDNPAGLIAAVTKQGAGAKFEQVGMERAYCGTPRLASAAEGEASIAVLAGMLHEAVKAALGAK
jgi:creatinine amidohydrolase